MVRPRRQIGSLPSPSVRSRSARSVCFPRDGSYCKVTSQCAAAKAGLRMIAQSMAHEYGPQGIHVAHVTIDGERLRAFRPQVAQERGEDGMLNIDAIAEVYWHIHHQPRSAWTHEVDLRPFKEPF
jgi:NAD(P)-dependent dehydrogenase (short-subunit alcohol dehydrogenase family)